MNHLLVIIANHLKTHWRKYLYGGCVLFAGKKVYEKGKKNGKIEGVKEQADRDEKKMRNINQKHEDDRKRWKEQQNAYEELLKDVEHY